MGLNSASSLTDKFPPQSPEERKSTYAKCKLELERWPLKERSAVVVAPRGQPVRPGLFDVHAVYDFVVSCDLAHGGATVPEEDGAKSSPDKESKKKVSPGQARNSRRAGRAEARV